ncbi:MAG: DUF1285 domain-containing protein [Gammaproteobacteria bacterium]
MTDSSNNPSPDPFAMVNAIKTRGPAPVHLWDPPFCGDIDMRICRDGSWVHEGRPIRRMAMVKLFASILKREGDEYFLVTPVEKVRIQVEDTPFLAVAMDVHTPGSRNSSAPAGVGAGASGSLAKTPEPESAAATQEIIFTTNVGEEIRLDSNHPLTIGAGPDDNAGQSDEPHPVIKVRSGLHALITRAVFYRLVELAVSRGEGEQEGDQEEMGVWSCGLFFPLSAAPGKA